MAPLRLLAGVAWLAIAASSPACLPEDARFSVLRVAGGPSQTLAALLSSGASGRRPATDAPRRPVHCGAKVEQSADCVSDRLDAEGALVQAVLWRVTGEGRFAEGAVRFLDVFSQSFVGYSGRLGRRQAAWALTQRARAAALLLCAPSGPPASWSADRIAAFRAVIAERLIPLVVNGSRASGDVELSMIEAMAAASELSDKSLLPRAVEFWRQRLPSFIYAAVLDGKNPHPPPPERSTRVHSVALTWPRQYVFKQSVDGVTQVTCSAFGSAISALSAALRTVELALAQGVDLLANDSSDAMRVVAAVELHARVLLADLAATLPVASFRLLGPDAAIIANARARVPTALCGGERPRVFYFPSLDHAVLFLHRRGLGLAIPFATRYVLASHALSRVAAWPRDWRKVGTLLEEFLYSPAAAGRDIVFPAIDTDIPRTDTPLRFAALFTASSGISNSTPLHSILGGAAVTSLSAHRESLGSWLLSVSLTQSGAAVDVVAHIDPALEHSIISSDLIASISDAAGSAAAFERRVVAKLQISVRNTKGTVTHDVPPFYIPVRVVNSVECGGGACMIVGSDALLDAHSPAAVLLRLQLLYPDSLWVTSASNAASRTDLFPSYSPVDRQDSFRVFSHPGVVVDRAQLAFIRARVNEQAGPIYAAFRRAAASDAGSRSAAYGPPPEGIIDCGAYSLPDYGCSAEGHDGEAALIQSILWAATGDSKFAKHAIRIINSYGRHLLRYDGANSKLQAAWSVSKFGRAAEILRHTSTKWKSDDVVLFEELLRDVSLPLLFDGAPSYVAGNWDLSMIESMATIAVFSDDTYLWRRAMFMLEERIPAYVYNHADGDAPAPVQRRKGKKTSWFGQVVFDERVDGVTQETCRDFGHVAYGLASIFHVVETARTQGVDLYAHLRERLVPALELHAYILNAGSALVCNGTADYFLAVEPGHWHDSRGVLREFPPVTATCLAGFAVAAMSSPLLCGGTSLRLGASGTRAKLVQQLLQSSSTPSLLSASGASAEIQALPTALPSVSAHPKSRLLAASDLPQLASSTALPSTRANPIDAAAISDFAPPLDLPMAISLSATATPSPSALPRRNELSRFGNFPRSSRNATNTFQIAFTGFSRIGVRLVHSEQYVRSVVQTQAHPSDIYMHVFEPLTHGEPDPKSVIVPPFEEAASPIELSATIRQMLGPVASTAISELVAIATAAPRLSGAMLRWPLTLFSTAESLTIPSQGSLGFTVTAVVSLSLAESCVSEGLLELLPSPSELHRGIRPSANASLNRLGQIHAYLNDSDAVGAALIVDNGVTAEPGVENGHERRAQDPSTAPVIGLPGSPSTVQTLNEALETLAGVPSTPPTLPRRLSDEVFSKPASLPLAFSPSSSRRGAVVVVGSTVPELPSDASTAGRHVGSPLSPQQAPAMTGAAGRAGIPYGVQKRGLVSKAKAIAVKASARKESGSAPRRRPKSAVERDLPPAWDSEVGPASATPRGWASPPRYLTLRAALHPWVRGHRQPTEFVSTIFPMKLAVVSEAACARAGTRKCILLGRDLLTDPSNPAGLLFHLLTQGGVGVAAAAGTVVDPGSIAVTSE